MLVTGRRASAVGPRSAVGVWQMRTQAGKHVLSGKRIRSSCTRAKSGPLRARSTRLRKASLKPPGHVRESCAQVMLLARVGVQVKEAGSVPALAAKSSSETAAILTGDFGGIRGIPRPVQLLPTHGLVSTAIPGIACKQLVLPNPDRRTTILRIVVRSGAIAQIVPIDNLMHDLDAWRRAV